MQTLHPDLENRQPHPPRLTLCRTSWRDLATISSMQPDECGHPDELVERDLATRGGPGRSR